MRLYRLPLRESCRASNAFNVRHALTTAFRAESTAAASQITLDAQKDPDRWDFDGIGPQREYRNKRSKAPRHDTTSKESAAAPAAQVGGGFADFESFNVSLSRRPKQEKHDLREAIPLREARWSMIRSPKGGNVSRRHTLAQKVQSLEDKENSDAAEETNAGPTSSETKVPSVQIQRIQSQSETALGGWRHTMQEIAMLANEVSTNAKRKPRELTKHELKKFAYRAKVIEPRASPLAGPAYQAPSWVVNLGEGSERDGPSVLEEEISRFFAHAIPTPAETAARQAVVDDTQAMIRDTLTNVETKVFGSEVTGLALATSDIDIHIGNDDSRGRNVDIARFGGVMRKLAKVMEERPDWICVTFRQGKYPIINAQHKESGIDVQIVSAPSTDAQQEWTAKYLAEMPHLRATFFVLRTMFGMRGLVDVFYGGTGSYGLFMMLVASLRRRSSKPATQSTAAEQLRHFLDFYSDFDTTKYGLTIEPNSKPFKKHAGGHAIPIQSYIQAAHRRDDPVRAGQWAIGQIRPLQPYLLCLQDPANPKNDLGRKSNAIKHIIYTIKHHRHALKRQMEGHFKKSPLLTLIGRSHEVYHEQRKKVEEYGLKVMASQSGDGHV